MNNSRLSKLSSQSLTEVRTEIARRDPVVFARQFLDFHPDPWQARALRWQGKHLLLNCSRQSGKSTTIGILALHYAKFRDDALVLLISPSLRQSGELFRKVTDMRMRLNDPLTLVEDNRLSMRLANGSRVVSLPASEETVRGFSDANLIIEDEASRVPDELYYAMRPMLAVSGGTNILMSTPFGKRGHFHHEWTEGGDIWERIEVQAPECPRISKEFLEQELAALGKFWFDQEYLCNPPEAPIWMGDFSFLPLGQIHVGDTVIGWNSSTSETSQRYNKRRLCRARVVAIGKREADMVAVRMESGRELICTPDHKWLTMSIGKGDVEFYCPAVAGRRLARVIDSTKALPKELLGTAAWLGGIYDGEGSADFMAQSQTHNPDIYQAIETRLLALGFRVTHQKNGMYFGGRGRRNRKQALVDFLNWTQPVKQDKYIDRIILSAHFRRPDRVVEVVPVGRGEVVSLQTTTGNYVAWGYASKNCKFVETLDQVFSYDLVMSTITPEVTPLFGAIPNA